MRSKVRVEMIWQLLNLDSSLLAPYAVVGTDRLCVRFVRLIVRCAHAGAIAGFMSIGVELSLLVSTGGPTNKRSSRHVRIISIHIRPIVLSYC